MCCRPFQTGVWSRWTDRSETSQPVTARGYSDPSAARGGGGVWREQRGAQCPQLLSNGKTSDSLFQYLSFSLICFLFRWWKGLPLHRPFALCDEQIFLNICARGTLSPFPPLLPVTFLSRPRSLQTRLCFSWDFGQNVQRLQSCSVTLFLWVLVSHWPETYAIFAVYANTRYLQFMQMLGWYLVVLLCLLNVHLSFTVPTSSLLTQGGNRVTYKHLCH